jgi:sulfatase maturation enzyme AslB (radical SAM superfamily)
LLVVVHNEMAAHAAAIYDRLVSLGARYLQFQPLMSDQQVKIHLMLVEKADAAQCRRPAGPAAFIRTMLVL